MAYDYTAATRTWAEARRAAEVAADRNSRLAHWLHAVDVLQTLSSPPRNHCPLTPLLWMQYARTVADCCGSGDAPPSSSSALQMEWQTLQLGLTEFPGSALLQLRSVVVQVQQLLLLLSMGERTRRGTKEEEDAAAAAAEKEPIEVEEHEMTLSAAAVAAVQAAIQAVGQGSHRNEDDIVVVLYRIGATLTAIASAQPPASNNNNNRNDEQQQQQTMADIFIQRSRVPIKDANHQLVAELQQLVQTYQHYHHHVSPSALLCSAEFLDRLEEGRRFEARVYRQFATYEDAIEMALHRDGALTRLQPEFHRAMAVDSIDNDNDNHDNINNINSKMLVSCWEHIDWDVILRSGDQTYGMGLGSAETATAFVQYARALKQFQLNDNDDNYDLEERHRIETNVQGLTLAVYERGVAECPCIEYLWLSYIRDLQQWIQQQAATAASAGENRRISGGTLGIPAAARLQTVTARAVRNCPYSAPLLQQKLLSIFQLSSSTTSAITWNYKTVVDPDQLLDIVQEGLDMRFLPDSPAVAFDLYLLAIRIVKRRILSVLAERTPANKLHVKKARNKPVYYDDGDPRPSFSSTKNGKASSQKQTENDDAEAMQEVGDLLEDIGDMYDEVESRLRKDASSWSEGRALLWKDRAQTEALLLNPLREVLGSRDKPVLPESSKVDQYYLQSFEKCLRAHSPPHPDSYIMYIRQYITAITTVPAECADEVLFRIRRLRCLFEKGVGAVGKSKTVESAGTAAAVQSSSFPLRDYETALVSFCNEWLEFERVFGSERSLGKASKAVEKKLQKLTRDSHVPCDNTRRPQTALQQSRGEMETNTTELSTKRKHERKDDVVAVEGTKNSPTQLKKKARTDDPLVESDSPEQMPTETKPTEAEEIIITGASKSPHSSKSAPKVRVGGMEYPAHPLTVRVSNLSLDTDDMDLVDTFRPKCGAIVHAKIIREKQQHGKGTSKGWGLIQFELCESAEKALALDDTLGIHEKLVKVDRSHMPAVSVVPPGMHRVRAQGEGKVSKRNQKRRERKMSEDGGHSHSEPSRNEKAEVTLKAEGNNETSKQAPTDKPTKAGNFVSALAFLPRGIGRGSHQKPRIKLDGGSRKTADK